MLNAGYIYLEIMQMGKPFKILIRGSWLIAAALLLGFFAFANLIDQTRSKSLERADAIAVLTGGQNRIAEAIKLLAHARGKRMLISGVNKQTSKDAISRLMPKYERLFKCCVDVGYRARDTIGNAEEIGDWARAKKYKSLIVVTASYHMPRSVAELKRVVPDVRIIRHPVLTENFKIRSWWSHPVTARLLVTEYAKFLGTMGRMALARITGQSGRSSSAVADTSSALTF